VYFYRPAGMANNAATIHTPQIVAPVARHVGCEETRTWRGFNVTLYRWMLNTATDRLIFGCKMEGMHKQ
jgi:hypothetical protein